jgi:hypothetical protein
MREMGFEGELLVSQPVPPRSRISSTGGYRPHVLQSLGVGTELGVCTPLNHVPAMMPPSCSLTQRTAMKKLRIVILAFGTS